MARLDVTTGLWKNNNPGLEIGHKLCFHRGVPESYLRSAFALRTSTLANIPKEEKS